MAIPRDSLEMSKLHPAYVAGFMDGEGCIRIDKSFPVRRSVHHKLVVTIGNNENEILWLLQKQYGGNIHRRCGKKYGNTYYMWDVRGEPATKLLEEILPYLHIKLEQAEKALEFQYTKTNCQPAPGRRLSQEEITLREKYYQILKELKSKRLVTTTKGHLNEMMV